MKLVILAGGGGTRLFPLSRGGYPKQFLSLDGEKSLLADTIHRFKGILKSSDIIVVTNEKYHFHVRAELAKCGVTDAHLILEPAARNTTGAIALAAKYCLEVLGCEKEEVLYISPSDHIIRPLVKFHAVVRDGIRLAATGKVITFGIKPDKPKTGYGYIHAGTAYDCGFNVEAFQEKPDLKTAQEYIEAGDYYWNSGMFAFSIDTFYSELKRYQPEIYSMAAEHTYDGLLTSFTDLPDISIDYAIAEKSDKVVMVPFTAYWNDIGSWDAIYEVLEKDENGNAIQGDVLPVDCKNTLVMGKSRLIAGIGLEDVLIVETDDVILVAKKGESQKVKEIVSRLKAQGRSEAEEASTVYRPWGSYTVLGEGPGYKIKKIMVKQGHALSLQMHYHRSEHWMVTTGTAQVTVGEDVHWVHKGESIYVPKTTKHRLYNPGKIPLEIIEIQNGDYLEEDDIVRFEDNYGRVSH